MMNLRVHDRLFLDLSEPSTSKGIRHVNTDVQCGPDTGSLDVPLLTHTPSIQLQKMFKTGIVISDSMTELKAEAKGIIDFGTSTLEHDTTENVRCITENAKNMCDEVILSFAIKRNNANSNLELLHKSVSSAMNATILTDALHDESRMKQISTMMTNENFSSPCCRNVPVETDLIKDVFSFNKMDDSLSDHSAMCGTSSSRIWKHFPRLLPPSPHHKEVQSTDTSTHGIPSMYDKQYSTPKLSFVGAHVHSYKDRDVSEDILYQGVWQKNRMQRAPKKRSLSDITTKNSYIDRKYYSKEKIKSGRSRNSTSDLKSSSTVTVKRNAVKLTTSKDFISKNIISSGKESPKEPKAKKIRGSKKSTGAKSKQNFIYKKTSAQVLDKKQFVSPNFLKKEQVMLPKRKQDFSPNVTLATRKSHYVSPNTSEFKKDEPPPNFTSYCISNREITADNVTVLETKPELMLEKATAEIKPDFMSQNATLANADFMIKNMTMIETILCSETSNLELEYTADAMSVNRNVGEINAGNTYRNAVLVEPKPDLVISNTFVETKPDVMPTKSTFNTFFPNCTKVIEMQPYCNDPNTEDPDPEFISSFESLAKLKQDIISSNEVLARLQQDFEQKVEKRILGSRNRKPLNVKHKVNIYSFRYLLRC